MPMVRPVYFEDKFKIRRQKRVPFAREHEQDLRVQFETDCRQFFIEFQGHTAHFWERAGHVHVEAWDVERQHLHPVIVHDLFKLPELSRAIVVEIPLRG